MGTCAGGSRAKHQGAGVAMYAAPALRLHNEITVDTVLSALGRGKASGLTANELVYAITGQPGAGLERQLRQVIEALRMAGHPVCGIPTDGYYLAATAEELNETCEFLYSRSVGTLKKVTAMKHVAMPDLRGQLGLPLKKETP